MTQQVYRSAYLQTTPNVFIVIDKVSQLETYVL